jgi:hypothetical protein
MRERGKATPTRNNAGWDGTAAVFVMRETVYDKPQNARMLRGSKKESNAVADRRDEQARNWQAVRDKQSERV